MVQVRRKEHDQIVIRFQRGRLRCMLIPAVGVCDVASSSCNMITKCMLTLGVNGACEAVFTLTSSFFQTAYFLLAYFSVVHLLCAAAIPTSQCAHEYTHKHAKYATSAQTYAIWNALRRFEQFANASTLACARH